MECRVRLFQLTLSETGQSNSKFVNKFTKLIYGLPLKKRNRTEKRLWHFHQSFGFQNREITAVY